jgi:hypothetical protein
MKLTKPKRLKWMKKIKKSKKPKWFRTIDDYENVVIWFNESVGIILGVKAFPDGVQIADQIIKAHNKTL